MRKLILYILPFIGAVVLFAGLVFVLNPRGGKGALQVTSTPKSKVYLNGRLIGETPLCRCKNKEMFSMGEYSIRLVPKEGELKPFEEKVKIENGVLTVLDRTFGDGASSSLITLEETGKRQADLMVITFPDKADVILDSNLAGQSPLLLKNITESDHELKLIKDGYLEKILRIKTSKGFSLHAVVSLGVSPNLSGSSLPIISASPTPSVQKILILETPTGFLRVREDSSLLSAEIDRVNPRQTFELIEEREGWFKIKLESGKTGWVSSQYAEKE
ncbi:MAG: hypothetical protein A2958_00885 [Candidatus Levybacteria bacterium RIFCSPLOWO2_01_FULL_38_13]|nr:MAG: hypothetical protein A2629_00780 [Candidatus Levybacteria bacterium RIFCSPHIGHO2_01_FULL_41_15]OGH34843.1 MAG: hypothetical protein A2958_00885 [Candidatus Levybacteria bacterium RIFCSPLOWO2_01_FULL_38_13]